MPPGPRAELRDAVERSPVAGRPLFAANTGLDWPEAPHLALWHAVTLLREHRGDGHVSALTVAGVDPCEAHVLRIADDGLPLDSIQPYRGWGEADWAAAATRLRDRGWLADGGAHDDGRRPHQGGDRSRHGPVERRARGAHRGSRARDRGPRARHRAHPDVRGRSPTRIRSAFPRPDDRRASYLGDATAVNVFPGPGTTWLSATVASPQFCNGGIV